MYGPVSDGPPFLAPKMVTVPISIWIHTRLYKYAKHACIYMYR